MLEPLIHPEGTPGMRLASNYLGQSLSSVARAGLALYTPLSKRGSYSSRISRPALSLEHCSRAAARAGPEGRSMSQTGTEQVRHAQKSVSWRAKRHDRASLQSAASSLTPEGTRHLDKYLNGENSGLQQFAHQVPCDVASVFGFRA